MDKIAAGLEADGILTSVVKTKWHTSTINKILRNEKYIEDALLQKTYTTGFLNMTHVKNNCLFRNTMWKETTKQPFQKRFS